MERLARLARKIDDVNRTVGLSVAWLAIFMVLIQFLVVVLRYVFGYGSIFIQETVIYLHGLLFMLGSGYTMLRGGHVRVDIFYRDASPRTRAKIDLFGVFFFLIPVCAAIVWFAFPYTVNSWRVLESSNEASGIPAVFVLKSSILVFSFLMVLQGLSLALRSFLLLAGHACPDAEGD